jgi:hypothetical protein
LHIHSADVIGLVDWIKREGERGREREREEARERESEREREREREREEFGRSGVTIYLQV